MWIVSATAQLRHYPPQFGLRLVRLRRLFCREAATNPVEEPAPVPRSESLAEWFHTIPWDDLWDDANMMPVLGYLRGNRGLCISDAWRSVFPKELPMKAGS